MGCKNCADTCSCAIIGVEGVSVSGAGSGANPFVVSADFCDLVASGTVEVERDATETDFIMAVDAAGNCVRVRIPTSDINVQSLSYDSGTGVLTLTETDASTYTVTLPI